MDISLTSLTKSLSHVFKRYHVIIYVLVILGGLGAAIFTLNATVNLSGESGDYVSNANNTRFDAATIERINQLRSVDQENTSINFNNGRTNPFVE